MHVETKENKKGGSSREGSLARQFIALQCGNNDTMGKDASFTLIRLREDTCVYLKLLKTLN